MCNRIKIGLIFDTREEVNDFIETYAPTATRKINSQNELVYGTPIMVSVGLNRFVIAEVKGLILSLQQN